MLSAFDERVTCPICVGNRVRAARFSDRLELLCASCRGTGKVSRFYAEDYAARGRD